MKIQSFTTSIGFLESMESVTDLLTIRSFEVCVVAGLSTITIGLSLVEIFSLYELTSMESCLFEPAKLFYL